MSWGHDIQLLLGIEESGMKRHHNDIEMILYWKKDALARIMGNDVIDREERKRPCPDS